MRSLRPLAMMSLLGMALPGIAWGEKPYPRVEVVAEIGGKLLSEISDLRQLERDIQTHVMEAATKTFPCMEWVTGKQGSTAVRARLRVELSERPFGKLSEDAWIDLALSGMVENEGPVALRTIDNLSSTVDPSWTVRNAAGLRQQVFRALDDLFKAEEFRHTLEEKFIAEVPIANNIDLDARRIIVPVDAYRLRLADESLLNLRLIASMCNHPPGYCTIELASEGPAFGKFQGLLQCDVKLTECCHRQGWFPDLPAWLATKKADSVRVYLGVGHQHCLYGYTNCPDRRYGTYRYPGSQ